MKRLGLVVIALGALVACKKGTTGAGQCVDNGNCGEMQACVESQCVDVACLSSRDCGLEEYCDKEANAYTCKSGCAEDGDCPAGSTCDVDDNECEEYGCRATDLDCAWGEVCDDDSGECEQASGAHCQSGCDALFGTGCPSSAICLRFDAYSYEGYCLEECQEGGEECPRGYECSPVYDYYYNVIGNYCIADCPNMPN